MAVARYYSSTAQDTTLTAGVTSGATTLPVAATTGFPTNYPYSLVIDDGTASEELVSVTGAAGLNLTVTRGYNGTTAASHLINATVKHCFTGQDMTDFRTHEAASLNVHGLGASDAVVGDKTVQTLTNKTIDGGSNTLQNIPGTAVTGVALPLSTVTTKGDLIVATGSAAVTRLAAGTNGQLLVADSTQAGGVGWQSRAVAQATATVYQTIPYNVSTTALTFTTTVPAGAHLLHASVPLDSSSYSGTVYWTVIIQQDGGTIQTCVTRTDSTQTWGAYTVTATLLVPITGDGASHTFNLNVLQTNGGSASVTNAVHATATSPAVMVLV